MDCHIHTSYSDGLSDAEDVICKCRELQVECFAITDHDTICELKRFEGISERLIFGTEITAIFFGTVIHILAYFSKFPADEFEIFLKNNRIKSSIMSLRRKNYNMSNINTVKEITKEIKKYGGISVIAHPYNYWDIINDIIDDCDGMELVYPSHEIKDIERMIEKYGERCRFFTSGTDFHGDHYIGNDYVNKCCQVYKKYLVPFSRYFEIK